MTARLRAGSRGLIVALLVGVTATTSPRVAKAQAGAAGRLPPVGQRDRAHLEQQLRERFAGVVQQRLRLTDAQMVELQQTNARYEPTRRRLFQQEREVRMSLRREAVADSAANQQRVADLITRAIAIQRQRLDLVDAEQKELTAFLTPLQRARYLDLQEKVRQRVDELRRAQQGSGGRGARRPFGARRGERP